MQWRAELLAYMRATVHKNADQWIACAGEQGQPIVQDDLGAAFGDATEVMGFSMSLNAQLVTYTTNHPPALVHIPPEEAGLMR